MIFGEYPCCNGDLVLHMPDDSPQFMPEDCPHCGVKVWHKLSRIQSESWTEYAFLLELEADEVNKSVSLKNKVNISPVASEIINRKSEEISARFLSAFEDYILNGDDTCRGGPSGLTTETR